MKKRIVSLILTALMIMGLSVIGVSAETYYDIFVGSEVVTSENAEDVLGDGTVSFDFETNTLTLNNASIQGDSFEGLGTGIYAFGTDLTIELVGDNVVSVENPENDTNAGIYVASGKLTIRSLEGGTLTINAGDATDDVCGIYTSAGMHDEEGFLKLDSANITINCGAAQCSTGIRSVGPMYVSGGDLSIEFGEAEEAYGIETSIHYVYDQDTSDLITFNRGHLSFTDDAKVKITADEIITDAYGIKCDGDLTANKAELDITTGSGYDEVISSDGMMVPKATSVPIIVFGYAKFMSCKVDTLSLCGGGVNIMGGKSEIQDETTGETIKYGGYIEIYDGAEISIKCEDSGFNRFGMQSTNNITINGGKLTIEMGKITGDFPIRRCYGMHSGFHIYINGGTTSISVPERVLEHDDFSCISQWYGGVHLSDNITVTGEKGEFINGGGGCIQDDPKVPVVFTDEKVSEGLLGDADMDGQLNVKDATAIQKFIAGLLDFIEEQKSLADFNGDGDINVKDATAIQKRIAGLI